MTSVVSGAVSERVRRRLAWTAPVLVAALIAAVVAVMSASASGASPKLTPRTAAQLLAAVGRTDATALSGTVTETANLGLPSLPGVGSRASLSWQTFITGTHSARVWVGGPDRQRVALIGELSEADVVHNGRDVWTYTSETNTVTHTVLPRAAGSLHTARSAPSAADLTPGAAAARVLKAISRSTSVTVGSSRMVADRPAYTLSIRPKDKRSTVREVTIAIDATKFVPLQVQIFGAGSSPAFEVGFATISFTTPAAATFRFKAPAGATSSSDPLEANGRRNHWHHGGPLPARTTHTPSAPKVIGSGWTSVLELPSGPASAVDNGMLRDLTSAVGTSGARLLHTALLNAVIMPDGRVLVGAVSPALLQHIAATRPR